MKRLFAILLACVLLLSLSASAQTRQRQIALEGMTETVTETFCDSGLGFSFWYDDSMLEVDSSLSEDSLGLIVRPSQTDQAVYLELMSSESVGVSAMEYLELYAPKDGEYEEVDLENGVRIVGYRTSAMYSDTFVQGFYVVMDGERFVAAAGTWPLEAEEGWGMRLRGLLQTVELNDEPEDEGWGK